MSKVMMQCGHAANATDTKTGAPVCVICIGIHPGATKPAEVLPDLTGRKAKCAYGDSIRDSAVTLPFFEHRPHKDYDSYYCGCHGWD